MGIKNCSEQCFAECRSRCWPADLGDIAGIKMRPCITCLDLISSLVVGRRGTSLPRCPRVKASAKLFLRLPFLAGKERERTRFPKTRCDKPSHISWVRNQGYPALLGDNRPWTRLNEDNGFQSYHAGNVDQAWAGPTIYLAGCEAEAATVLQDLVLFHRIHRLRYYTN